MPRLKPKGIILLSPLSLLFLVLLLPLAVVGDRTGQTALVPAGPLAVQGAVEVSLTTDIAEVRPGGELEVTARVLAHEAITGLLLHLDLPSGWELFPVDNGNATVFKPSSHEWLWIELAAGEEERIRFRVRAAADASPGDYQLSGRVLTAVPELDFALEPLIVRVAGEPVEFNVEEVIVVPSPPRIEFRVEGTGVLELEVRVYSLSGRLLFSGSADGSRLEFRALDDKGRPFANGVYLYTVTVHGVNEGLWRSGVRKLALLR